MPAQVKSMVFSDMFIYLQKTQSIYISIYILVFTDGYMPLIRKIRCSGNSTVLTIPSQLVEALDIDDGDVMEIIPLGHGELKIKKSEMKQQGGTS